MKIVLYGGSFNPPHIGHVEAALSVSRALKPDRFLIMPDHLPPHKELAADSPGPEERLRLCRLAFRDIPGAEVSDLEICREGASYTADTVEQLRCDYPNDELTLVVGGDMFFSFESWYRFRYLLEQCTLAVLARCGEDVDELPAAVREMEKRYAARIVLIAHEPVTVSSSDLRYRLPRRMGSELLPPPVYEEIIRKRFYDAQPEFTWLREQAYAMLKPKRIAHVAGCESAAVELAQRWGADEELAAEAAILHDITKKLSLDEQLNLCRQYGIIYDHAALLYPSVLHAMTGAALAADRFGAKPEVVDAIRWHTTGKPDMTMLEKIVYLADTIEPGRDFPSVKKLRKLANEDLDAAMAMALEYSLSYIAERGQEPDPVTAEAAAWYAGRKA